MRSNPRALVLSLAFALASAPAWAADELPGLKAELQRLAARIEALEKQSEAVERAFATERISETEPEIAVRLKAVESQSLGMRKAARMIEALDGISAGFSLTTVAQRPSAPVNRAGADVDGKFGNSQLNYRGDAFLTLPLEAIGDADSKVFAHIRFGQGSGLNDLYTFSKPNASAFRVISLKPDDSVAILGQAWYQATIALPLGGFKAHSKQALEINFGKMDPYLFFDQNAAANDETRQFLNTAFVHNPLLDAGGDVGIDANGFTPGVRISYLNKEDKREPWRLSLGVFGAGRGANYSRYFSAPFVIAQAETQLRLMGGLLGNYRVYYWRTGQAPGFDGASFHRSGWGLSLDQRVGDEATLFARYGQHIRAGGARFDRALTVGAEIAGYRWHRGGDSIGLAGGLLHASRDFRAGSSTADLDGNGIADFAYAASGSERVAEIYYRWRIGKQFEISPGLQLIANPGADSQAKAFRVLTLRAQLTY